MTRWLRRLPAPCALLAVLLASLACNKSKQGPAPAGMGPPGGPGASRPIAEIMVKLTKGPPSLTQVIGAELGQDPPPWDTLKPQAKEFVQLASTMGKYDPPKGSKESWAKLTGEYTQTAVALEKAIEAQDAEAAAEAHNTLAMSCMACHREHRMGGPGGGPGGMRGGRPGGGQPPQ